MKFSLSMPFFRDEADSRPWHEMFDFAHHAESAGYDAITIGHHHFQAGYPSDPLTLMAAIAARTDRIRVGTGIFQLPLHHPLRVAEQVATIDVLSGGRASIGVGLGWWDLEYETFGVPMSERGRRMEESLRIMRLAWEQGTFSFDGEFFEFPEVTVHPRPVQRPNPPVYVAGAVQASVDRAARLGDGWLCSPGEPIHAVETWSAYYRNRCAELGRPDDWFLRRYVWIGDDREQIERDVLPQYVGGLVKHQREGGDPNNAELFRRLDAGENISAATIADDQILWGTPDDIVRQIERYRDLSDCQHLHLAFAMGLPGAATTSFMGSYDDNAAMVKLFADEVIPAFA